MQIVTADIGGTHARFALAEVDGGRVVRLGEPFTVRTAEHASLQTAWEAFAVHAGTPLPHAAGIAVAGPVGGDVLKLTNNPWVIRPALFEARLGLANVKLVNDFGAVAHAVAQAAPGQFRSICGPARVPETGVTTIVGPGTGLGVALLLRRAGGYQVIETEGGHIDYAPTDAIDDAVLALLRQRHRRVSVERVVAGPGLADIHDALAGLEGRSVAPQDDKTLWTAALAGADSLASAALDRFCLALGSVTGDIALAQGANSVVIAGGLGLRLAEFLPRSGFGQRFVAKGRFERMMAGLPVRMITHPQPGLFGAAAAFAQDAASS